MKIKNNLNQENGFLNTDVIGRTEILYFVPLIGFMISTICLFLLDASWGLHLSIFIMFFSWSVIAINISENSKENNASWHDREYTKNSFAIFGINLMMILLAVPFALYPMIYDYNHQERIEKVLSVDKNITVLYSDYKNQFIIIIPGQKQPIIAEFSNSYNRVKADYLDGKIVVQQKEVKMWYDDNSSVKYYLDDISFN